MEQQCPKYLQQIPPEDWERTPVSVKKLVEEMAQGMEQLKQQQAEVLALQQQLLEKVNRTSKNSSSPPSLDPPGFEKKAEKAKSGRKRGGQKGHKGHSRELYPLEECSEVIEHYPQDCANCGEKLTGVDENPYRHQIVEIPPISPIVIEHRLHQLTCSECGAKTTAKLPAQVNQSGYGVRVVGVVALLSGVYRNSHRMVQSAMEEVFSIKISLATISKLREEASLAVAGCVTAAKEYIQNAQIVGADETSFPQRNIDGQNPENKLGWLWVVVTPLVTFFEIALSRGTQAAQEILGANFAGILNSDRHHAYNWVDLERRQFCWAHLRREFIKISERSGVSQEIGKELVEQQEKLFKFWYQVRDGTLSRDGFCESVQQIRSTIKAILETTASYEIGAKENTPLAKTVRTCRQLLKAEKALWLFVTTPGVEPTNNAAERAIRPAVIWRRTSFGTQTQTGSNFVARILTVVTTLKSQRRNVLEFITQAVLANRQSQCPPSLLPNAVSSDSE